MVFVIRSLDDPEDQFHLGPTDHGDKPDFHQCRIDFDIAARGGVAAVKRESATAQAHWVNGQDSGYANATIYYNVQVGAEIQDLMTAIEAMNLPQGAQARLTDPLDAACNKMDTFAKRVMGSRELTQPQLDRLLIEGQQIQDRLGC